MQLNTDWRHFQNVFHPRKKVASQESTSPIFVVAHEGKILAAYSGGDDLSEQVGRLVADVAAENSNRELLVIDRALADQSLSQALGSTNIYEQTEALRAALKVTQIQRGKDKSRAGAELPLEQHFLLRALQTWWAKVLPSNYGIYLRIDGRDGKDGKAARHYMLVFRRGKLDEFQVPDLSKMIPDRRKVPADVVKFLAEKAGVPVQGLFVSDEDWARWSESKNPWPEIAQLVKKDPGMLVPSKWRMAALIGSRAFLGV